MMFRTLFLSLIIGLPVVGMALAQEAPPVGERETRSVYDLWFTWRLGCRPGGEHRLPACTPRTG